MESNLEQLFLTAKFLLINGNVDAAIEEFC